MKFFVTVALAVILLTLAVNCSPARPPQSELGNAVYPIEIAPGGLAELKDGRFEAPVAPGSASKLRIQLTETRAPGDINGDGVEDTAVILTAETGGTGVFTYLAAVLTENGKPKPTASVLIGDRIPVQKLSIHDGVIETTVLTRKPDEPMTAKPTVESTRVFRFDDGKLTEK